MPPVWIRNRITNCPKKDQYVKVSCRTSPVTQVAEVEVNRAQENGAPLPDFVENGSISSNVPTRITDKNPSIII